LRPRYLIATVALLLLAAAIAGVAAPHWASGAGTDSDRTLTVTGTGSVDVVPDRASFGFTAETRAKTASQAIDQNGAIATKVVDAVRGKGVARPDIQTSQVSLQPQTSDDGRTVLGYLASTTVSVTVRHLDDVGGIVDGAVAAGATGVSGPNLLPPDQDSLYETALKHAVDQARSKARALAGAAGVPLGDVRSIVEGGGAVPLPSPVDAKASAPIEPGTVSITASVSVTFALG
jgi:uncharacterized protein